MAGINRIIPVRHILLMRLPVREHARAITAPHKRLQMNVPIINHVIVLTEYTNYFLYTAIEITIPATAHT